MQKSYTRLNQEDREEISRGLAAGWTFTHIAFNLIRPVVNEVEQYL